MASVYILLMSDKRYYVGSTENLQKRLHQHRLGKVKTTKSGLPVRLVYSESFPTRGEARKKELRIKGWKSRRLIDSLIRKRNKKNMVPSSNG